MDTEQAYYNNFYTEEHNVLHAPALKFVRNQHAQYLKKYIQEDTNPRILSLGSGDGYYELQLAPFVKSITGIEISETAAQRATVAAANQGTNNVSFLVGDIREFDQLVQGQKFDLIFAMGVLHHLPNDSDISHVFASIQRVLQRNGRFISVDPNYYRAVKLCKFLIPDLVQKYHSPDERELVPGRLRRMLLRHGFRRIDIQYTSYFLGTLAWILPNLPQSLLYMMDVMDIVLRNMPFVKVSSTLFSCIARK